MKTSIITMFPGCQPNRTKSVNRAPSPHCLLLVAVLIACFGLMPGVQALVPAPDGCYPNYTTAEGCDALSALTSGAGNTGLGWRSLFSTTDGSYNTGIGAGALALNNGDSNTAVGAAALLLNITGTENTAVGIDALVNNDSGAFNTAIGSSALMNNTVGAGNTATGYSALIFNTTGSGNAATGNAALAHNTTGIGNTAIGGFAGFSATTGNGNVYIGNGMMGMGAESDHTYIRNINTTTVSGGGTDTVTVNLSTGRLGHLSSSRRYKEQIQLMDAASETLYRLRPVTYRYKQEIDPSQSLDYGLVAEEVAKVDPNLANRNRDGQLESVRYNAVNAMLLNEFLKEHKKGKQQDRKIEELEVTVARLESLVKEQATQIKKVSAQIEVHGPTAKVVANKP